MTPEEKAKAYDEALLRAKNLHKDAIDMGENTRAKQCEIIFPELKDSDEKIKKEIIEYIKTGTYHKDWVAWLEKQGEQSIYNVPSREIILAIWNLGNEWKELTKGSISTKYGTQLNYIQKHWDESEYYLRKKQDEQKPTADKVETKFHVGDWIVQENFGVYKVIEICESWYEVIDSENNHYSISFENEYICHNWTIQFDAKDGDVLYSLDSKCPFIFKHRNHNEQAEVYCGINIYDKFFVGNTKDCIITTDKYIPATKEQRDLLFQKMKESGYKWSSERKELKKVEPKFRIGDWVTDGVRKCQIYSIDDTQYWYAENCILGPIESVEKQYHLWNIYTDAKDGDILCTYEYTEPKIVFILKGTPKKQYALSYHCYYNIMYHHFAPDTEKGCLAPNDEDVKPATKEQRELLFQKIKESGFEWDEYEDKKELKKIEPKFHVGNWVTDGSNILKIRCVGNEYYCIETLGGYVYDMLVSEIDSLYHRWTVEDAKDGDLLVCNINKAEIGGDVGKLPNIVQTIFIFKNVVSSRDYIHSYSHLYERSVLGVQNTMYYNSFVYNIHPATKEQRDFFFIKLKEAGYDFDMEKKELKNDDEKMLNRLIGVLDGTNKEDYQEGWEYTFLPWLKSLRLQKTWKLNNEQIESLEHFVRSIGESGYASPYDNNIKLLYSLLEQLKKL